MKRATATCYWCSKAFEYIQSTKPWRYCSAACTYKRERHLQNERRARARSGALNQHPPLCVHTQRCTLARIDPIPDRDFESRANQ